MANCLDVWVLLLNWKNAKDTIECLQSIVSSADSSIEGVVVCDNGSDDGSIEAIQAWFKMNALNHKFVTYHADSFDCKEAEADTVLDNSLQFVLIDNAKNLGFAGGNNIGLDFIKQFTSYEYVFVLNNDTLIEHQTVSNCIEHFRTNEQIGMCGCKVVYEHSRDLVQAYGGATYNAVLGRAVNIGSMASSKVVPETKAIEAQLDYILGAALMVSKKCLDAVGNMEDKYFLYYEEIDWTTRAKRAGFELGFAKDSTVYHKEGASIGSSHDQAKRSYLADYYLMSSRIKFTRKFYPYYLPSVYLFCAFQALRSLARIELKRFKVMLQAMFQIPLK